MHGSVLFHIIADPDLVSCLILRRLIPGHNDLRASLFSAGLVRKKHIKGRRLFSVCRFVIPDLFDNSLRLFFIVFYDPVILSGKMMSQRLKAYMRDEDTHSQMTRLSLNRRHDSYLDLNHRGVRLQL